MEKENRMSFPNLNLFSVFIFIFIIYIYFPSVFHYNLGQFY